MATHIQRPWTESSEKILETQLDVLCMLDEELEPTTDSYTKTTQEYTVANTT